MLLAAPRTFVEVAPPQPPRPALPAGAAGKALWPALPEQIVVALLVAAEAGNEARQVCGQILGQHCALQPWRDQRHAPQPASGASPNLTLVDSQLQ
jgi:hypothetical protein